MGCKQLVLQLLPCLLHTPHHRSNRFCVRICLRWMQSLRRFAHLLLPDRIQWQVPREIDTMYLMHVPPRKSTGWNLPEDIVAANAAAREQGQRDRGLRERKHNLANGGEKNEVENAGNGSTGLFEGNRA